MHSRRKWILLSLVALCTAAGAVVYWQKTHAAVVQSPLSPFASARVVAQDAVPVLFQSPKFNFVDQEGRPTSNANLNGRIWIADFIFTHCAGNCPKVTAQMVNLQKALDDRDIRFVSFSVDPDRDDPRTLKDYAASHSAGETRWTLLRPPNRQTILNVAQRMAAVARSNDASDTIVHTDFFIVIDHHGQVRGLYDSKDADALERLKKDVASIARERVREIAANNGLKGGGE